MDQTEQTFDEPKNRPCLGWCNKEFKPEGKEHFCKECDKIRRRKGHQVQTHGQPSRSFGAPPSL